MNNWLSHLKVLDVSNGIGGAFCARLLGRCGAEVVKVEPPVSGDPVRDYAPFFNDLPGRESSGFFIYLNSGKRSITLDLTRATGRRIFQRLVEEADVLVESFDPGYLEEMGLGYDELSCRESGVGADIGVGFRAVGAVRGVQGQRAYRARDKWADVPDRVSR